MFSASGDRSWSTGAMFSCLLIGWLACEAPGLAEVSKGDTSPTPATADAVIEVDPVPAPKGSDLAPETVEIAAPTVPLPDPSTPSTPDLSDYGATPTLAVAVPAEPEPATAPTGDDGADPPTLAQVTTVFELADVEPTDWAFQALQSLVETYGCIEGYPNRTFRGDRPVSRYEFAAALNACMDVILSTVGGNNLPGEDLATLQRLQDNFQAELTTLTSRVDVLEAEVAELASNQFSTTVKLGGEAIFSFAGASGGSNNQNAGLVFNNRLRLNFNASFTGSDLLLIGLQSSDYLGGAGNTTGSLPGALGLGDPVFGTASNVGLGTAPQFGLTNPQTLTNRGVNDISLYKLLYVFPVGDQVIMFVGSNVEATDAYPAIAPFANESQGAVSRFATTDNAVTRVSGGTSGIGLASAAGAIWNISDRVNLTAFYGSVNSPIVNNAGLAGGTPLGAGVFGGSYVISSRLTADLSDRLRLGINYARSYHQINILGTGLAQADIGSVVGPTLGLDQGIQLDSFAATLNWQVSPKVDLTLSGSYIAADLVGVNASTNFGSWLVGLTFRDVFQEGNLAGLIFGQPLNRVATGGIAINPENAEPYHLEAFFNWQVSDNISITPGFYAVFNPEGLSTNETTYTGVLRTTFSF
ncbi:MAG: iron uptake porin [Leptolyngbya sp.]|nr:iron uptake porin [Leptolyngbya sp.]